MENRIKDIDFINGVRKESYQVRYLGGQYEVYIKIEKGDEVRTFAPIEFLQLISEIYYLQIDKTTELDIRLTKVYDAKRQVIHFIQEFNQALDEWDKPHKDYNYPGLLAGIEITIDKIKLELDNKKYNLEIKKYELEVMKLKNETKWYKEPIFLLLAAIAFITGMIALYNFLNLKQIPSSNNPANNTKSNYNDSALNKKQ